MKMCYHCNQTKSLTDFSKNKADKDGYFYICKACCRINHNKWRRNNWERVLKYRRKSDASPERKRYQRTYVMNRLRTDPQYKLAHTLRVRIRKLTKGIGVKRGSAVKDLGCSLIELMRYFESKFLPNMSWANHGEWHIDHIRPLSSFDLTDKIQFLTACHYTNLQPLWKHDNLQKSDT